MTSPTVSDDLLLTERDAAKVLGFVPATLRKKRCTGDGPEYIKLGAKAVRYLHSDLMRYVAAGKRRSTSAA